MAAALKDPSSWFAAGRLMACQKMPYFSSAVMGLEPWQAPGLGTLGVTARAVLLWDPALHTVWSVEHLAWVLLHEALHVLHDHAGRCAACGADGHLFNLAGDAESNDDLTAAGAVFPPLRAEDGCEANRVGKPSGVLPKDFGAPDGKLAEEYYSALRQKQAQQPQATSGEGEGQGEGEGRGEGGNASGKGTGKGGKAGKGAGKGGPGKLVPTMGAQGCGSGSGGPALPGEESVPASMGKSRAEQRRIQREVAEAVRTAASKGRGTVPAGIARWAEEVLGPPRIPWQQKLARLCRSAVAYRAGAGDYRYDRPSRRQGAFGYGTGSPVFPALRMPVPQVAIVADTSGSMGEDELRTGLEETKGILAAVGATVDFYACDAEVHTAVKVRTVQEACRALKGGGGTDMAPAFAAIMRAPRKASVIVVCTDGQIGDPGPKPAAHVIWLVVGPHRNTTFPWGEVVEVES